MYNGASVARHPVEEFWTRLQAFHEYPSDVTPVPELLPGTAAFAASAGLHRPSGSRQLPPFPFGGLLIIGHNLDSRSGYEERRQSGTSHGDVIAGTQTMSTWRGLYSLLDVAGVPLQQMFFTNVFVGLKEGASTGPFTNAWTPEFRSWCRDFLRHQVLTMRPRVTLVLGKPACKELGGVSDPGEWLSGALPQPGPVAVRLHGHRTTLVPAHHTSMQKRIADDADALRRAWVHGSI